MKKLSNDRFLKALRREPVDCAPIWIMRQAGRYLPEYRSVRAKAKDFMTLCKTPQWACEVTLQPLDRFPLDAAILFSDILTIPDAMGLGLYFEEGEGPRFRKTVRSRQDFEALLPVSVESDLSYVLEATALIAKELSGRVPLIGFSGSPWTLACYMIEGSGSKDFSRARRMIYEDPRLMHDLLSRLSEVIAAYLMGQVKNGAQVLQLFDSWGGLLAHHEYVHFSLFYMQKIIAMIRSVYKDLPIILFTKGGGLWLENMLASGADCLGLDWSMDIKKAKQLVGNAVSLQGNLDPCVLFGSQEVIRSEVSRILDAFSADRVGHVFNLGHGILPSVQPEKVAYLVDLVHELSARP
jgi:uroporphyrinogen decarboxylase